MGSLFGNVHPDAAPVRQFAHDAEVRRDMLDPFLNRGYPTTEPLLKELFDLRHEMATWPNVHPMPGRGSPAAGGVAPAWSA